MTTLAIDIGGTKLAAALVDGDLQIHQRRELPTPASKTPDALRIGTHGVGRPTCLSGPAGGGCLNRNYS